MKDRSQPAPPPLTDAVRAIFREKRSGVVEVEADTHQPAAGEAARRRLFFVDGELHLPAHNPLAAKLTPFTTSEGGGPLSPEARGLLERIARLLGSWRRASYRFYEGRQTLAPDLVGPLPTGFLLMEWAVAGRGGAELLAELGGPGAEMVATVTGPPPAELTPAIDPAEAVLLARLAGGVVLGELLRQSGDEQDQVIRRVARLRAVGLVRTRSEAVAVQRGSLVPAELLQGLSERVERELTLRPLELPVAEHRERLGDLLARAGGLTHYEMLGVSLDATPEEVYDAYARLARVVHPSHAPALGLEGREAALWLLFERATEAYLALSHTDRRQRYDHKIGLSRSPVPDQEVRAEEARRLARSYYNRARDLIELDELHFAVELMRQAVQADPRPEYHRLLGEALAHNPNWSRKALDSYRQAVEGGVDDAALQVAMGELCERLERPAEARRHYQRALELLPGDPDALHALERLGAEPAAHKPRGGLFGIFRRRRG
jgi:curved DNA-binding protein CbpA